MQYLDHRLHRLCVHVKWFLTICQKGLQFHYFIITSILMPYTTFSQGIKLCKYRITCYIFPLVRKLMWLLKSVYFILNHTVEFIQEVSICFSKWRDTKAPSGQVLTTHLGWRHLFSVIVHYQLQAVMWIWIRRQTTFVILILDKPSHFSNIYQSTDHYHSVSPENKRLTKNRGLYPICISNHWDWM